MKYILFLVIFLFFFPVFGVFSQETGASVPAGNGEGVEEDEADEKEEVKDAEVSYIEMDIRTSSLRELAAWCRDLGLSEGGSREDLASRLRNYYELPSARPASTAGQRVITIESAKTTEYFTLDVVDEEYARLKGDVIISLKDGGAVHRIKAWEILYNRTRNVMTATGNVEYVKEEGNSVETFKGESITVNLDNWSSIFMDGVSEKSISGQSSAYRFAGTVISRNSEDVTVLTGAEITNPANEEAFWSLNASKLWLLPGNDWAVLNAVLRVGNIPVLYVPFFFYPSDEIVFHPVLGTRSREGTFLQTTTYLLGRPKSSGFSENSITRIFGGDSDGSDKVREGVFLRTTGERRRDTSGIQLSAILDAYVNLGVYLGTELTLPGKGDIGATNISAGLGVTRDIYVFGSSYSPFPRHDGDSVWNKGRLVFFNVPFRYRVNATGSFKIPNGSFSWGVPFYSDPYVNRDFMRRSESLDWLGMLREGTSASTSDVTDESLGSYEWKLSGSYTPTVTAYNPYITSFSISSMSSTLLFSQRSSRNYSGPSYPPNPGRAFFFPNRFTIFTASAAMAGTPFKTGAAAQNTQAEKVTGPPPGDALLPDLPISPWEDEEVEVERRRVTPDAFTLSPPVLNQRFTLASLGGLQFSVDYRLSPTAATELQFRSTEANWRDPEDINWTEVSTVLSRFRSDGDISFGLSHSAYTGALRLSATGSWQDYLYLNEWSEEFGSQTAIKNARDRAYNETFLTSAWDFSNTVRPFFQNPVWGGSSFQYSLKGLLAKTNFDTTSLNPSWNWAFSSWDNTKIDSHQVSANFAAKLRDKSQTLSISAVLPPKDTSVSGSAAFRAWISETSLRGRIVFPMDEEQRKIEPVYFTETLRFGSRGNFQQYIVFDPDLDEYTTLTSSLTLSGFTASFSALYGQPYRYNYYGSVDNNLPNGWIQMVEKDLHPNELKLGYNNTFARKDLWSKRLSFSVALNTSMAFDLQRYTNSKFIFGLGIKLAITNFLDVSISTNSENAVMFKYFQGLPFFGLPIQLYPGEETNFFIDLLNSFRFDNNDLRRRSGFKLKALDLSFVHNLGDWNAKLSVKTSPYLPSGSTSYKFNNEVSFLIQWVPIGEIKTQIDYSRETLTVK